MSAEVFPLFTTMLQSALGDRLAPGALTFDQMFAEDGVFEFPYAPPGLTRSLTGPEAIAEYLGGLEFEIDRISTPMVRPVSGEDAFVLEFEVHGRHARTNAVYEQRYISVIELRDGRIQLYRDYWNPLAILAALEPLNGSPAVTA